MRASTGRAGLFGAALSAILASLVVPLSATVASPVPEIDGASISAGLGLLAAGILVLRSRRRPR